ncbi:hypothetical protein FDZ74_14805 [bacterium]|nr:MAG: hypothetical protein FDZ74_14805 [bacterium]
MIDESCMGLSIDNGVGIGFYFSTPIDGGSRRRNKPRKTRKTRKKGNIIDGDENINKVLTAANQKSRLASVGAIHELPLPMPGIATSASMASRISISNWRE